MKTLDKAPSRSSGGRRGSRAAGTGSRTRTDLHRVLEKLPAGAYTCDADGLITWYNDRAVEVWGRAPNLNDSVDRFCGSFKLLVDGEPITHSQCSMARAIQENRGFNGEEITVEREDGSRITALAHANPLHDENGNVIGAVNVLVDITDRKRAEDALREADRASRQEFERLLNTLPTAAYTCDRDGLLTYYNRRAAEVWGREPKLNDPADRYCGSVRLYVQGEPVRHEDCFMAVALQENKAFVGNEVTVERPDGTRVTGMIHITPFHDESGAVSGAVNVIVDISDRKRAEDVLHESDRRKDMFLAKLAQEMRKQLGPTRGVLQVLREGHNGAAQEQARGLLQRQIEQIAQLVDNLVDVSSITRGRLTLRKERMELAAVVRGAVKSLQQRVDTADHKLVVSLPSSAIFVNADPNRLAQALLGLLTNAVRYTDRGGRIWLTVERSGSHAVLSVRDSGAGIAASELPQIFDMIANIDRTVSRASGGLGIGLALVRGIVELHGGIIEARSDGPGHGSEFIVRLPVAG